MRRVFFLAVGCTTFFIGCGLTWLHTTTLQSVTTSSNFEVALPKGNLDGITPTVRACGDGYSQGYELPGGQRLGEGNSCYASFKEARNEMKVWLKLADKLIETNEPFRARNGLSERVVASFPKDEFGNDWVTIMWVNGSCIHWISAPSLELAQEFEKSQFNPYKFDE